MTPLAIDMYLPAMPAIAGDLSVPLATIQRSLSTFLLGFAIGQLIHGPLSDGLGRRPVMLTGLILFSISSFGAALANDAEHFLGWRIVQAFGGAAGSVVINAIITDKFQGAKAIKIRSTILTVMLIAPLIAPTLGGFLLMHGGWRSIYHALGVYAVITLVWIWYSLDVVEQPKSSVRVGAILKRYRAVLGDSKGWAWIVGLSFNSATMFAFLGGSPYLYIEHFQVTPQVYGFLFAANVVVMATGAMLNGRLAGKIPPLVLLRRAQWAQLTCLMSMVGALLTGMATLPVLVVLIAGAIGLNSFVFPNATQSVMELFRTNAGTASAVLGASQFGMGAIASSIVAMGNGHGAAALVVVMATTGSIAFILVGIACRHYVPVKR
ncbi:multidrug effflux MFS transporter [Echinimonas agarilytica]|uniref:Bcr/CflA family efflux transporter n=2 Tax=Echinimonas agarilytica TaxID=1215918 RepID=A0AA41W978_9GAMM|nr:multidrug effflux MFS transporter [Echinimonas agarilytica]